MARDDALKKYQTLTRRIRAHSGRATAFILSSVVSNAVFGVWGFLVYFGTQGQSCERPLRGLLLGCAVLFTAASALTACLYGMVDSLFFHVAEHNAATTENAGEYEPVQTRERLDDESDALVVERSQHEELTRPMTDRITATYCSYTCILCAFATFAVYLFTALTWVLVEKNNCETAAPSLFKATRAYTYGLVALFVLHVVWNAFACRYCVNLCEIYGAQQRIVTWSASKQARRHRAAHQSAV